MVYDLKAASTPTPLGTALRQAREVCGLSQCALAERAGVSAPYLNRLERGHLADPRLSVLRRLAEALGCSLDFLANGGAPPGPRPPQEAMAGGRRCSGRRDDASGAVPHRPQSPLRW